MSNPKTNEQVSSTKEPKEHFWKPGTLIQLHSNRGFVPLFRYPLRESIKTITPGECVIYLDYDNQYAADIMMIKVIHGEDIGWTYAMCGKTIEE